MNSSPMRLDYCCLDKLEIICRDNIKVNPDLLSDLNHDLLVEMTLSHLPDENQKLVSVLFKFLWDKKVKSRFDTVQIKMTGCFTFAQGISEEVFNNMFPSLCIANLYGTARGIVGQATGICRGGVFWLPTLNVHAILEKMDNQPPAVRQKKSIKKSR